MAAAALLLAARCPLAAARGAARQSRCAFLRSAPTAPAHGHPLAVTTPPPLAAAAAQGLRSYSSTAAEALEEKLSRTSAAYDRVCKAHGPGRPSACKAFREAYATLGPDEQAEWWERLASEEDIKQVEALGAALPRGSSSRLSPQMLNAFARALETGSERFASQLVSGLGVSQGLLQVMELRTAVRTAVRRPGTWDQAYALERLDLRIQQLLSAWFNPGILEVERVTEASSPALRQAAFDAASSIIDKRDMHPNHRAFVLTHPQVQAKSGQGPLPLFAMVASLHGGHPGSLEVAVGPRHEGSEIQVACCWALEEAKAVPEESLTGLGLAGELFQKATDILRREGGSGMPDLTVTALTPLQGFARWLRDREVWEEARGRGMPLPLCKAIERAVVEPSRPRPGRSVTFMDADQDKVTFTSSPSGGELKASFGADADAQHVSRLRIAESEQGGRSILLILEPGSVGMQVEAPQDVVEQGVTEEIAEMWAEAGGDLESAILAWAGTFLERRQPDGLSVADPLAHFHLSSGAALRALHWRAMSSTAGATAATPSAQQESLATSSLGVMATFSYESADAVEANGRAYATSGAIAMASA